MFIWIVSRRSHESAPVKPVTSLVAREQLHDPCMDTFWQISCCYDGDGQHIVIVGVGSVVIDTQMIN